MSVAEGSGVECWVGGPVVVSAADWFLSANDQSKRVTVRLSDAAEFARSSNDVYL